MDDAGVKCTHSADCPLRAERSDPAAAYRGRSPLDLEALGSSEPSQDSDATEPVARARVTVTMRGLFLDRHLEVQHSAEPVRDSLTRSWGLPRWDFDTIASLGVLARAPLFDRGARWLDVATGLSIFPTELSALGAHVDTVDRVFGEEHPAYAQAAAHARGRYARELERLSCWSTCALPNAEVDPRYHLSDDERGILARVSACAGAVADSYPRVSGRRHLDDARTLSALDSKAYDVVTSGWLLCHLDEDDERAVWQALVRVTRPGGFIHVRAGYGGVAVKRLSKWFADDAGALRISDSDVTVDPSSHDDLVVLRVGPLA
ncbi:MAG: class I SAM-dependent methyltransferase [Polyangiaceae bacterium]